MSTELIYLLSTKLVYGKNTWRNIWSMWWMRYKFPFNILKLSLILQKPFLLTNDAFHVFHEPG